MSAKRSEKAIAYIERMCTDVSKEQYAATLLAVNELVEMSLTAVTEDLDIDVSDVSAIEEDDE